jgi:3-mercaptopyruvate sulfurtransferase SseA
MGEPDQQASRDQARQALEQMHSVTESLRALLADLRGAREDDGRDDEPRVVRIPGSAPSR